ncbi:Protein FlmC [bioreactor metagenome]|uniref:Protein FlmC n=1 Tax=bioreactor metagenome TaxID=1076179 RepID=A0A645CD74_9ZZZZ
MTRHQQNSLLDAARQGEEGYETATKYPDLVCIDSVSHIVNIHLPDPEIALRNPLQGHEQGGGGFYGLRIR